MNIIGTIVASLIGYWVLFGIGDRRARHHAAGSGFILHPNDAMGSFSIKSITTYIICAVAGTIFFNMYLSSNSIILMFVVSCFLGFVVGAQEIFDPNGYRRTDDDHKAIYCNCGHNFGSPKELRKQLNISTPMRSIVTLPCPNPRCKYETTLQI